MLKKKSPLIPRCLRTSLVASSTASYTPFFGSSQYTLSMSCSASTVYPLNHFPFKPMKSHTPNKLGVPHTGCAMCNLRRRRARDRAIGCVNFRRKSLACEMTKPKCNKICSSADFHFSSWNAVRAHKPEHGASCFCSKCNCHFALAKNEFPGNSGLVPYLRCHDPSEDWCSAAGIRVCPSLECLYTYKGKGWIECRAFKHVSGLRDTAQGEHLCGVFVPHINKNLYGL